MTKSNLAPENDQCENAGELRQALRLTAASLVWGLCFVAALWVLRENLLPDGPLSWLVAALPTVAGFVLLSSFTRYLHEIDELQRSIQLQAMALGFGGGYLAICAWATFEQVGAPHVDPLSLLAIMPILYAVGTVAGHLRYR